MVLRYVYMHIMKGVNNMVTKCTNCKFAEQVDADGEVSRCPFTARPFAPSVSGDKIQGMRVHTLEEFKAVCAEGQQ